MSKRRKNRKKRRFTKNKSNKPLQSKQVPTYPRTNLKPESFYSTAPSNSSQIPSQGTAAEGLDFIDSGDSLSSVLLKVFKDKITSVRKRRSAFAEWSEDLLRKIGVKSLREATIKLGVAGFITLFSPKIFHWLAKTSELISEFLNAHFWAMMILYFLAIFFVVGGLLVFKEVVRLVQICSFAKSANLVYCKERADSEEFQVGENFIRKKAKESTTLHILGATGIETFVKPSSPLYDAVRNAYSVEVILLNPCSPKLAKRVNTLQIEYPTLTIEAYKQDIEESISYLHDLKNSGKDVKLFLYDDLPFWKVIRMEKVTLFQHYNSSEHVNRCPVYILESPEKEEDKSSCFFFTMFDVYNRQKQNSIRFQLN